jgi:hypothetical protein
MYLLHTGHPRGREQEAAVDIAAVDAEEVDLVLGVRGAHVAMWREPAAADPNDYDVSALGERTPLALNAHQPPSDVEDEIRARILAERLVYANAQVSRLPWRSRAPLSLLCRSSCAYEHMFA